MNSLFYDSSRKNEMQAFLDRIYQISKQNSNIKINKNVIYNQLRYGLLPKGELDGRGRGKSNRQFFEKWSRDFSYKRNVNAFCDELTNPYWFQFTNKLPIGKDYIKLYISINAPHMYRAVSELFSFIEEQNIFHISQVSCEARLDNVIIRLGKNDIKSLEKIIEYINSNKYIKSGLNENIPFIPTINGVGVINEHGNSFTTDISIYISNYINKCIDSNIKPSVDDFRNYIRTFCTDKDLVEAFENAYTGRSEFKPKEKRIEKSNLSLEQKTYLLVDALKATYLKYGIIQVRAALESAVIDDDFSKFSNGDGLKLRDKIRNNLTSKDIMQIIKYALPNFIYPKLIAKDEIGKITQFVNILFENQLVLELDESCLATVEKYDAEYLEKAIRKYMSYGDPTGFTRHLGNSKINFRETIMKIKHTDFLNYIKISLKLKGYDIDDEIEADIPGIYANTISNSRYTSLTDSPVLSR